MADVSSFQGGHMAITISPQGTQSLVNTQTIAGQDVPAVARLANGTSLIVWTHETLTSAGKDIYGQYITASGTKSGLQFGVTGGAQNQMDSAVATLGNGSYVVASTDYSGFFDAGLNPTPQGSEVVARIFGANGSSIAQVTLNTGTLGSQFDVALAALSSGGFVAVWSSVSPDYNVEVVGQRFDALGGKVGDEFLVNAATAGEQGKSAVTGLANGGFAVTWMDGGGLHDASSFGIEGQVFNADGSMLNGQFAVNTTTANEQRVPDMATLTNGNFVVTWDDDIGGAGALISRARLFAPDGTPLTGEFQASTGSGRSTAVTALPDGYFAITWETTGVDSEANAFAQVFDASGNAVGDPLRSTAAVAGHKTPDITALSNGNLLIAWAASDGSGDGIYSQLYSIRNTGLIVGTSAGETVNGTGFSDSDIRGLGGNDVIDGKGGADTMRGGLGNDTFYVDDIGDIVIETAGQGIDGVLVAGGITYVLRTGSEIENLQSISGALAVKLVGNELNNHIVGGEGADILEGRAGDDTLIGGAGVDKMTGGTGNDTYYVDQGTDSVREFAGEGSDTVYTSVSFTLKAGIEVEVLHANGGGNLTLVGNEFGNSITGGGGADTLKGGGGADMLDGGAGADKLFGGDGDDSYAVDDADDLITEAIGDGNDTGYFDTNFTLRQGVELENMYVGGFGIGRALTGNEFGNNIYGADGADVLKGGGGGDALAGGGGNDNLRGGAGVDRLAGGLGFDQLYGEADADTFVFDVAPGQADRDNIWDFVSGVDKIEISAAAFGGDLVAGALDSGAFVPNTTGRAGNEQHRFILDTDVGRLYFDADGSLGGADGADPRLVAVFVTGSGPQAGDFMIV
jgi:serralysin